MRNCEILGILNLTHDSFSDGGKYLNSDDAIVQAFHLWENGANTIDLGAQSSNPDAETISEEVEWSRLEKVILAIEENFSKKPERPKISIDSFKPGILKKALEYKIDYWNDITALADDECIQILESSNTIPNLILMYSHSQTYKAERKSHLKMDTIIDTICTFFDEKRKFLLARGIPEDKLIFDPGMGFFLGEDPNLSYKIIKDLEILRQEFPKLLISVSRKSFLTAAIGAVSPNQRSSATLAAEIVCYQKGVDFIRTHEPKQLKQAIEVLSKIQNLGFY